MRPGRACVGRRGPRLVALGEARGGDARGVAVGGQRLHELRELAARARVALRARRGAHLRAGAPAGGARAAGSSRAQSGRARRVSRGRARARAGLPPGAPGRCAAAC